jgi:phage-related protein
MPSIGPCCHELRVRDADNNWRIVYRIDADAILIVDVFAKKVRQTPQSVIKNCRSRLTAYDRAVRDQEGEERGRSQTEGA